MQPFLVLGTTVLFTLYFAMFLLSNRLWPDETLLKVVNVVFALLLIWLSADLVSINVSKTRGSQTSLVYKVANGVLIAGKRFRNYLKPFQRQFIIGSLIAAAIVVLSFLSLGILGALLMEVPVMLGLAKPITGDNAWPAALIVSILWPLFIPFGVIVKYEITKLSYTGVANAAMLLTIFAGMAASIAAAYLLFPSAR